MKSTPQQIHRKVVSLLSILVACTSIAADAAVRTSNRSPIAEIISYTQYGNGDLTFKLSNANGIAACSGGFWLRATDGGFKTTVAMLMSAYHTGTPIVVDADDSVIWTGSSHPNCLVWDIRY